MNTVVYFLQLEDIKIIFSPIHLTYFSALSYSLYFTGMYISLYLFSIVNSVFFFLIANILNQVSFKMNVPLCQETD